MEMEDKEQRGVQSVVVACSLESTFCIIHQPLSFFFPIFFSAPSCCRRYQRHELLFNLDWMCL